MGTESIPMENQGPRILAVVQDIFFAAKITAAAKRAGVEVSYVTDERELLGAGPLPQMIIVDLNNANLNNANLKKQGLNPVELIGKLKADPATREVRVIGFLSHVQGDLKREAELAGCDLVLPRSVFS
ncbi:MAG: hypothetical protein O7A06_12185, partial [Acidobacteria bacterium]|nr:hypothetical protein [Acidobacteriota bacterium]